MSAKVTVIIYIFICFEIGILLLILPWYSQFWEENFFLYLMTEKFNAQWLPGVMTSGWVRGAVSGLGIVNVVFGVKEILNFRGSVAELGARLSRSESPATKTSTEIADDSSTVTSTALPDHKSSGIQSDN
ncbi:MAG: hypothetical protein ACOYLN_04110 [Blastocatellia bacterium]|jgi:hypothetical protein